MKKTFALIVILAVISAIGITAAKKIRRAPRASPTRQTQQNPKAAPPSSAITRSTSLPDITPPANRNNPLTTTPMTSTTVTFQTSDGVTIAGDWTSPQGASKAVLLLHMMPAARQSYGQLAKELNKNGFATLAIDLRGHGQSTDQNGKKLDYAIFTEREHQASRLDVDSAFEFLAQKGFRENAVSLVGASIGANLALDAMRRYAGVSRAVLLSPGLDYRGVKTEPAMRALNAGQKVWLVAAEEDNYSANTVLKLQQMKPDAATMTVFSGSDHGTTLFSSQTNLISDIVKFLAQ